MSPVSKAEPTRTLVAAFTADAAFEQLLRATFAAKGEIELEIAPGGLASASDAAAVSSATVVVADIGAAASSDQAALQRLTARLNGSTPVVVATEAFNEEVARLLLQLRITDFLVKPAQPIDLVRACSRALQRPGEERAQEAQIHTFLPASGGVGVTTLAIETAMQLMRAGPRAKSTCLVDLDFQHGACADYLDIEPRLDLGEIEPRPERLDRHLLEVMLSHHASGLAVIAAPNRPAEMRSFDPDVVTRLLDLVSTHFECVVIDMPRTWFSWTDSVLVGSNKLYIVTEMTVPGLRHAKQLAAAMAERLGENVKPRVIVNRFEQRMFETGLRRTDIEQALGGAFLGTIPNNYRLVREAIDRGVPLDDVRANSNVAAGLRRLLALDAAKKPTERNAAAPAKERGYLWAR